MTNDEKQAYNILEKGICFKNEHYEVGMLWKDSSIHLKNNKEVAVQRLDSLEKRLIKKTLIKQSSIQTPLESI